MRRIRNTTNMSFITILRFNGNLKIMVNSRKVIALIKLIQIVDPESHKI